MRTHKIAAIPGDGIGPEVIAAGVEVLRSAPSATAASRSTVEHFDWGSDYYKKHGVMMPEDGRDQIRGFDAILFGAVGAPGRARPHHPVGPAARHLPAVRPVRQRAPDPHPAGHHQPAARRRRPGARLGDRARELGRRICRRRRPRRIAGCRTRSRPTSRCSPAPASTRIMRFAFELARSRPRKLLTVVTKSNAQRHGMVMWDEIAAEVAAEFPDVTWDKMLVDAMTMRMVLKPRDARHHRRHQPARRHPVRSRGRAGRLARHRADGQPQSGARHPPRCSSRSTARRSTSSARASPIRSARSGPP